MMNKYIFILLVLCTSLLLGEIGQAELCQNWGQAKRIGALDHNLIDEASGIEASQMFPGRLYHINDSGGGQYFYITDLNGKNTQKIKIEGKASKKSDFEDIGLGRCFDKSCLFIGDIGDNKARKYSVSIIVVEEVENYGISVKPLKRIKLKYPDGPHNAEGLSVHPNGDIYIVTKEENLRDLEAYPSKVYKLSAEDWQNSANDIITLKYIGEIDLRALNPSGTAYGQIVSAFDIAPDGKSFLLLTYEDALEFNIDLSDDKIKPSGEMKKGQDYNVIELKSLPQQESIAYMPDGGSFLYSTEHHWFKAPILRVECLSE